jgi:hypothetical protein
MINQEGIEGGKVFKPILSQFISENWKVILSELKPAISR